MILPQNALNKQKTSVPQSKEFIYCRDIPTIMQRLSANLKEIGKKLDTTRVLVQTPATVL